MNKNKLLVKISGDTSELRRALSDADKSLEEFGETAKDVSNYVNGWSAQMAKWGLAFNAVEKGWNILKAGISIFTEMGDSLKRVSERTGVAVSSLSAMKYAAEQSGSSFETMVDSMKTFQEQLGAAQLGDQGAIDKLNAVGISHVAYQGLNGEEQFKLLADHIAQISDRAEQARTAIELFGDAGYELLPMFQRGSNGIDELCRKAEELGYTMGEEDVENAKMMTQSLNGIKNACTSLIREGIAAIATPLTNSINLLRNFIEFGVKITQVCKEIIPWIFQAAQTAAISIATYMIGTQIIAGWAALKKGIMAVNFACKLLNVSNPLGWIALGVGAVYALCTAFKSAKQEAFDMKKEMEEFNTSMGELASEQEAYAQKMKRLEELAEKQKLSNKEQSEAVRLVHQLNTKYPDLNIQIDKATGKITGLTGAYKALLEQMREERLLELGKKQEELSVKKYELEVRRARVFGNIQDFQKRLKQENLSKEDEKSIQQALDISHSQYNKVQTELSSVDREKWNLGQEQAALRDGNGFIETDPVGVEDLLKDSDSLIDSVDSMKKSHDEKGLSEYEKKMKELKDQMVKIQQKAAKYGMTEDMRESMDALRQRIVLLKSMMQESNQEKAEEEARKKAEEEAKNASQKRAEETRKAEQERAENTQRLKDLTAELQNASLTASQKELKAFQDINAELEKRLANQHDLTEEEKKAAQEALRKNQEAQQNFIQEKLDPAQLHYQREMDDARSVLAIEQDEYLQALEKAGHDENAPEVQKAKKEMEDAEAEISRLNIQGAEKEVQDAETDFAEKESAFQNAVSDEEKLRAKDELDAARQRLESARSGLFSLKSDASQKKVLEAGKQTQEKEQAQMSVRGSFSIWGLDSAVSSVPQQQLDYLKRITGFVNSILNQQKTEGVLV